MAVDDEEEAAVSGAEPGADNVVRVDFAARKPKPKVPVLTQPPAAAELASDRPEKLRMFARLIERGMVMVTVDARRDNARVPARLGGELQLNLNFSHKFGVADFFYDDDGVRASLSFQGTPFFVDLPWTAVYGMHSHANGERMIWPDSLPEELKALLPPQARHGVTSGDDDGDDDEKGGPTADADAGDDDPPPPAPRPTLRRVK